MTQEEIIKEFDEKFGYSTNIAKDENGFATLFDKEDNNPASDTQIKDFILSALQSYRQSILEEVEAVITELSFNECHLETLEAIKKLKDK